MPTGDYPQSGSITVSSTDDWTTANLGTACEPVIYTTPFVYPTPINNNKKGDDDMRYLYEVILVNPKNDEFYIDKVVARSETSALMEVYNDSPFMERKDSVVKFDDLKTSCRILMEWKKEKSLKKAIETIKEAVE